MALAEHDKIRQLTALLHSSGDPFWSRLRDLLRSRGVDPEKRSWPSVFRTTAHSSFGIVVSAGGSVFQFGFDYLHEPITDGVFTEWEDLTTSFRSTPHHSSIGEALRLVGAKSAG